MGEYHSRKLNIINCHTWQIKAPVSSFVSSHFAAFIFLNSIVLSSSKVSGQQLSTFSNLRCYRSTNISGPCTPLTSKFCLGTSLPFTHSSTTFASDLQQLSDAYEKLRLWSGLQNVPQCWAVVQPFLCSVYLPRCNDTQGVELPSKELCERTRKPCQIVHEINKGWPEFLQCNHSNFVSGCGQETYDKLTFNTSGRCEPPLVRTDDPGSWFNGVDGCGVPCDNPLFTPEQHFRVHVFVAVFGTICMVCTLFTVLTFIIDWKNANRHPALILFFINSCFFLGSIGWMSQFAGDSRKDIVCRKDGTVRKGEPQLGSNESISCTVVFVIVYYFLIAGVSWFVMLSYAWYLTFTALGTSKDALKSKTAYFHLISWCLPLVLTIICLAISEIDGDSVSGICFVGVFNHGIRALFVLVPVGLVIVIGTFFLLRGVYTLIKIKKEAPPFIPEKTFSKIRDTILRLGIFTAVALAFVFITFAVHVYIFTQEDSWRSSFREYMYCIANVSVTAPDEKSNSPCVIKDRPSLVAMQIHIFAFFGAGIALSSWSWTKASLSAWERFFRWIFHKPSNKPVKLKRHRMIAQAFEKRKEINQGRVSISYRSSHDDPLGMKFDLNSGSDDELSSNFAMAMPKLVRRRGGLIYLGAGMGRRYSDSDVQSVISTRRVSLESQLMEFRNGQFFLVEHDGLPDDLLRRNKKKKMKKKRGRLTRIKPMVGPMFSGLRFGKPRKGSDSSALSQMSAQSVRVSVERHSVETMSLASNAPPDTVLPAVTKKEEKETSGVSLKKSSRVMPYLELGTAKKQTDFSVFVAKNNVHGATPIPNGIGETSGVLEVNPPLPGAPEEPITEKSSVHLEQQKHHNHLHHQQRYPIESRSQSNSHTESAQQQQQQQKSAGSSATKSRHRTHKITVETHQIGPGLVPLHALMADISGGNWGVLLGKSGSSSGSDTGGGGASAYLSGGSAFRGGMNPYIGGPHAQHINGPIPHMNGPPVPHSAFAPYVKGGGAYPPYMGSVGGVSPYMGVTSMQMGGARPKVRDQWGHFPYYADNPNKANCGSRNQLRRLERERKREREMRRPIHIFPNSTFQVEDDDIESISA